MSSRRQFLTTGLMAIGAWSFSEEVQAGRRHRRCNSRQIDAQGPSAASPKIAAADEANAENSPAAQPEVKPFLSEDRATEQFIQPDSTRWQLLSEDMTEREVLALLGEPLKRLDQTEWYQQHYERLKDKQSDALPNNWTYGWLKFNSPAFPDPPAYFVSFRGGKVKYIEDPFNGAVSSTGKPTIPKLILPHDRTIFTHYPRWLDLRWVPPAGDYPQKYEIEIDFSAWDGFSSEIFGKPGGFTEQYKSDVPQFTLSFGGANSARWRVRARNRQGVSPWSEYWYFRFTK